MLAKAPNRGDQAGMEVTIAGEYMMASVHRDKQPMVLAHSCSSLLPGPTRVRNFVKYSKENKTVIRRKFKLEQPMVHSIYRGSFWAVDRFNKLSLGPNSIQYAVAT